MGLIDTGSPRTFSTGRLARRANGTAAASAPCTVLVSVIVGSISRSSCSKAPGITNPLAARTAAAVALSPARRGEVSVVRLCMRSDTPRRKLRWTTTRGRLVAAIAIRSRVPTWSSFLYLRAST